MAMGRPSKLNPELIKTLSDEIAEGMPFKYACDLVEISEVLFRSWLKQGQYDVESNLETLYADFFISVKKAYAKFIKESKRVIRKGESGWQGTAWWLERTNHEFILSNDEDKTSENIVINPTMKKKADK